MEGFRQRPDAKTETSIQATEIQVLPIKMAIRIQTQTLHQIESGLVSTKQDVLSIIYRSPRRFDPTGPAACSAATFKKCDLMTLIVQAARAGHSGPAGTDDSDPHDCSFFKKERPPVTQVFQASQNFLMGVRLILLSSTSQRSRSISCNKV